MREEARFVSDFQMLLGGAKNVVANHREHTYEERYIIEGAFRVYGRDLTTVPEIPANALFWQWEDGSRPEPLPRYYNPPFFLFLLSPLTFMDVPDAYLVGVGANVVGAVFLAAAAWWTVRWSFINSVLLAAALLSFQPFYASVHHVQPTIFIALCLLLSFKAALAGRTTLAAILIALAAAKPQWAAVGGLSLLRSKPRAFAALAASGTVLVLLPFLTLGPDALIDYVALITGRGGDDLEHVQYASLLLSWPGFLLALTGSVQPLMAGVLSMVTLVILLLIFRVGDTHLVWAATIFAALIAIPHSHSQEWVMVVPAAVFLLTRPETRPVINGVTLALLGTIHLGVFSWVYAHRAVEAGGQALYFVTPAAFLMIVWCAAIPFAESMLKERSARSMDLKDLASVST